MKRKTEVFLLILIVFFGFFLRIYNLGSESYWLDEGFTIHDISQGSFYNVMSNTIKSDAIPPFYIATIYFWKNLFGISEFAIRSFSVLFGTLSIILVYLILRELSKPKIALFASFLFSISALEILFSQEARAYALLTFLALISTYFLILALKKNNYYIIPYIVFSIFLIYTLYFCFFYLILQFLFIYYFKKDKLLLFTIGLFFVILGFIPWIPSLLIQYQTHQQGAIGTLNGFVNLPGFLANFGQSIFIIPFLLLSFIFLLILKKEKDKKFISKLTEKTYIKLILIVSILLLYLLIFLIFIFIGTFLIRYFIFLSIFVYFSLSFLLFSIKKSMRIILIIITIFLFLSTTLIFHNFNRKADWKEAIEFIEMNEKSNEIIIIEDGNNIFAFDIYYNGISELFPIIYPNILSEHEFLSRIQNKEGIWIVLSRNWFSKDYYKNIADKIYQKPKLEKEFKDINIYYYE